MSVDLAVRRQSGVPRWESEACAEKAESADEIARKKQRVRRGTLDGGVKHGRRRDLMRDSRAGECAAMYAGRRRVGRRRRAARAEVAGDDGGDEAGEVANAGAAAD